LGGLFSEFYGISLGNHALRRQCEVIGTSCFCFLIAAYPSFAQTLLQGKSQCKALSGIIEKTNKQKQQPNIGSATLGGRESSLEPILLGEWIGTPALYCIFGYPLSLLWKISFRNITQI